MQNISLPLLSLSPFLSILTGVRASSTLLSPFTLPAQVKSEFLNCRRLLDFIVNPEIFLMSSNLWRLFLCRMLYHFRLAEIV